LNKKESFSYFYNLNDNWNTLVSAQLFESKVKRITSCSEQIGLSLSDKIGESTGGTGVGPFYICITMSGQTFENSNINYPRT
jgi:hypothetical protein